MLFYITSISFLIFNIIILYNICDESSHYRFYKNEQIIDNEAFFNMFFTLLLFNGLFLFIRKYLLTESYINQNYKINISVITLRQLLLIPQLIFLSISLYYFLGLGNLFIKVLMIENNFINLDGIINLAMSYKIEKIYSNTDKIQFADNFIQNELYKFNTGRLNKIDIKLNSAQLDRVLECNTLKDIKVYLSNLCLDLFKKIEQQETTYNNIWYYLTHRYTLYVIGTVFICFGGYNLYKWITKKEDDSKELEKAVKEYVQSVTDDLKENKKDIGNLGARQTEFNEQIKELLKSNKAILDNIDLKEKAFIKENEHLKFVLVETLKKSKKNHLAQVKMDDQVNKTIEYINNNKSVLNELFKTCKDLPQFFDITCGSFKELYDIKQFLNEHFEDTKWKPVNLNDNNTRNIKPFSGKGKTLKD